VNERYEGETRHEKEETKDVKQHGVRDRHRRWLASRRVPIEAAIACEANLKHLNKSRAKIKRRNCEDKLQFF
jgi:hypothetical protein